MLPKAKGKQGSYPIPLNIGLESLCTGDKITTTPHHHQRKGVHPIYGRHSREPTLSYLSARFNAHRITALKLLVWSKPRPEHSFVHATRMMILYSKRNSAASDRSTAIGECESDGWRGKIRVYDCDNACSANDIFEIRPRCTFLCQVYIIIALETIR